MSCPEPATDASSVSSSVIRASMLERQRQVALRRRQNQLHSTSIMRSDARFGQNSMPVENSMTRVQMTNHLPHGEQQIFQQSSQLLHNGYNYNAVSEGLNSLGMNINTQMIPTNAFHRTHQMVTCNEVQQSYNLISNNGSDPCSQKLIQYRPSGDDVSELTDVQVDGSQHTHRNEPPRCVSMEEDERSSNRRSTFSFIDIEEEDDMRRNSSSASRRERSKSKLQRSTSSRSLSFNDTEQEQSKEQLPSSNASKISSDGSSSKEASEQILIHRLNRMSSITELDVDNPAMMRAFLTRPCPQQLGMIKCYIKRNKGIKNALFPEYRVYLKETNAFLMTSKKRMGNATSNYLISMGRNDFDNRASPNVLGKLRSNFLGTEYTIYDGGRNPHYDEGDDGEGKVRCELGAILYASATTLGAKGPRKIKACVGKLDGDNNPSKIWQPMNEDDDKMATCLRDSSNQESTSDQLVSFVNKEPEWNSDIKAEALNFNGKVPLASVKNFQLIDASDPDKIYLQFGRIAKEEFILDLQWPLSPMQAFAFALSSFDSKLGCD